MRVDTGFVPCAHYWIWSGEYGLHQHIGWSGQWDFALTKALAVLLVLRDSLDYPQWSRLALFAESSRLWAFPPARTCKVILSQQLRSMLLPDRHTHLRPLERQHRHRQDRINRNEPQGGRHRKEGPEHRFEGETGAQQGPRLRFFEALSCARCSY